MDDENEMLIEPSAGPYRGQRVKVSAAEGKRAIKEGWARDPFAPANDEKDKKDAPQPDEEGAHDKRTELAEAAAKRWGGEDEKTAATKTAEGQRQTHAHTRDMKAGEHAEDYETKRVVGKKDK